MIHSYSYPLYRFLKFICGFYAYRREHVADIGCFLYIDVLLTHSTVTIALNCA